MKLKIISLAVLLAIALNATSQSNTDINKTDPQGKMQGLWIKKYPDNIHILYEGTFLDNHPVGELKRYYEDGRLRSRLVYSQDGKKADAEIYHPNGNISSSGIYINQLKEGQWKFFSARIKGLLLNEESYLKNQKNGLSVKFYPDSAVAEKVSYLNDKREGEWLQYHPDGKLSLKALYKGGMLNGKFEAWYPDGKPESTGSYKNNLREGTWRIFKADGSLRYELNYVNGITDDKKIGEDAEKLLDEMDKNKGSIADPEKTGEIR